MAAAISATRIDNIERKVNEHEAWIDGNGKPGAKERLALLEQGLRQINGRLSVVIAINTTVGVALLGMMIYLIQQHLK